MARVDDGYIGNRTVKTSPPGLLRRAANAGLKALGLKKKTKPTPDWRSRDYFLAGLRRDIRGIPDERCFVLQNVVRGLKAVPGDVAECGLRFGKSTAFMLAADQAKRTYCLFDSFEGLSEPTPQDALASTGKAYWTQSDLSVPEDLVRSNLAGFDQDLLIFKGWIPDRFPEVAERRFALLHVDVDLYQPTLDALEFFWPRLAPGGMVVCDDYGSRKCPGAKRAMDEFFADRDGRLMELPTFQALVVKPG